MAAKHPAGASGVALTAFLLATATSNTPSAKLLFLRSFLVGWNLQYSTARVSGKRGVMCGNRAAPSTQQCNAAPTGRRNLRRF